MIKYGKIRRRRRLAIDTDLLQLLESLTLPEAREIEQYLAEWDPGTYDSVAQSILNHSERKGFSPLRYLRKAHSFNRKGATRIPRWSTTVREASPKENRRSSGYREDDSAVYRKGSEFLIVRPDAFGVEKIVTYGINED
jgi:hypothetical protein